VTTTNITITTIIIITIIINFIIINIISLLIQTQNFAANESIKYKKLKLGTTFLSPPLMLVFTGD